MVKGVMLSEKQIQHYRGTTAVLTMQLGNAIKQCDMLKTGLKTKWYDT